jgi:hypothetical protein
MFICKKTSYLHTVFWLTELLKHQEEHEIEKGRYFGSKFSTQNWIGEEFLVQVWNEGIRINISSWFILLP